MASLRRPRMRHEVLIYLAERRPASLDRRQQIGSLRSPPPSCWWLRCCAFGARPVHAADPDDDLSGRVAALRTDARAYEHGEGVARDAQHAIALYCEASRLGDAEAQFSLGWMYANGRGIPRDNRMASLFFALAADAGSRIREEDARLRRARPPRIRRSACAIRLRRWSRRSPPAEPEDEFVAATPEQKKAAELVRKLAPEYQVSPHVRARDHSRRVELRSECALAEERAGPDAAHSRRPRRASTSRSRSTPCRTSAAASRTCAGCSRTSRATWRWSPPPTTPAKARSRSIGGVPPYAETRAYVQRIKRYFRRDRHPFDATVTEPSPELWRIPHGDRALAASSDGSCDARAFHRDPRRLHACAFAATRRVSRRRRARKQGLPRSSTRVEAVDRRRRHVPEDPQPAVPLSRHRLRRRRRHADRDGRARRRRSAADRESRDDDGAGAGDRARAEPQAREAKAIAVDKVHDVALLRITGAPLPALTLGNSDGRARRPGRRLHRISARQRARVLSRSRIAASSRRIVPIAMPSAERRAISTAA